MPRQSRIDAPLALHHIIIRGIERKAIFKDDTDREDFIERLSLLFEETLTPCYAWALMPNHVHLLLRTGNVPIASIMRRLLTGHAVRFNRRHGRSGHLFQNRYKSILCQEDAYLTQLVGYIHLNPFRAKMVNDVEALQKYPFTGHSTLMGHTSHSWQDAQYVLALFGKTTDAARRNLAMRMRQWAARGRCPELTGGGLVRSSGGWRAVKAAHRDGVRLRGDERILGSSEFVQNTLKAANEAYARKMRLHSAGTDLSALIVAVCAHFGIEEKQLGSTSKRRQVAGARAVVSRMATRELSISGSDVARRLNVDRSAVSRAARRVDANSDLTEAAGLIRMELGLAESEESQQ